MAKAKQTPVQEEKLITLTQEQFQKLLEIREMLDSATDSLENIDGDDNLFEIGKQIGSIGSELIDAYNDLSDIIVDKQTEAFGEYEIEFEN